ncbi:MAG: glycerol-3-phosphate dehydrogenase C-terminal domain-containing protein, partial [Microbacterium sp.]
AWKRANLPGADAARGDQLLTRYGTRAAQVWQHIEQEPDRPLGGGALSVRELEWMVENEMVVRLADVVLRRTSIAFTGDITGELLTELADALAPLMGWEADRRDAEIEASVQILNDAHGLSIEVPARR